MVFFIPDTVLSNWMQQNPSQHNVILMCKLDVLYSRKQLTTWSRTWLCCFEETVQSCTCCSFFPCSRCCGTWVESEQSETILSFPDVSQGSGHDSDSSMWTQNGLQLVSLFCCLVTRLGCADRQVTHVENNSTLFSTGLQLLCAYVRNLNSALYMSIIFRPHCEWSDSRWPSADCTIECHFSHNVTCSSVCFEGTDCLLSSFCNESSFSN